MRSARFWRGVSWGVLATIAMSVLMIAATLTGVSPMPRPIPVALVARTLGAAVPKPLLLGLGALSHLAYGGAFGGALALLSDRVTLARGVMLGLGLWLLMQLAWLPYLGWGFFGGAVTPKIAVGTLVLHVVYGGTLGALGSRSAPAAA